ncbi:hypothetical protein F4780DRAFT_577043 [Xylariomycetidae sp. FL0641]|nr:hypothetical protein F4780DRAFT_577043 [Xylariomycetidae sp. FL0641]
MASTTKPRQPRLRASCDGCFLAKVKCSKARPICSRCLACGIECRYSPSSRAGKPKTDQSGNPHPNGHDLQHMQGLVKDEAVTYPATLQGPPEHMFRMDTGWATPPTSIDSSMSRNPSISHGLPMLGVEERGLNEHDAMSAAPDIFSTTMPWGSATELPCAPYPDVPVSNAHMAGPHIRSQSFDISLSGHMPWADTTPQQDLMSYSQVPTPGSMTSNYFPSPTGTPSMHLPTSRQKPSSSAISGGSCTCFTVCLQSLQALHNASSPASPPFDLVLSLNQKAVEGCAAMLACTKCFSRSGSHTATMLLATVIGKITSFYKNASRSYFETGNISIPHSNPGNPLGLSYGVYQLNGEDGKWFELEILSRELRKLEEVYAKFREVCTDLTDDPEITKAMIGYLGHNLGTALEVISHRKGDMIYAA